MVMRDINAQSTKLVCYSYDETIASVPDKQITVYSLKENKTIRQAISMFQKQRIDVKINYVVAMGEEGGTAADYIRALNTELISGKGADVLILDGLPVDSYIQQGVLTDIGGLLKPMIDSGELNRNIVNAGIQDGKQYYMPVRYRIPIIMGKQSAVESAGSLANIISWIDGHEDEKYLSSNSYEALTRAFLELNYEFVFPDKTNLNQQNFNQFIENLKKLADNCIVSDENQNLMTDVRYMYQSDIISWIDKKCAASMDILENIHSIAAPSSVEKEYDGSVGTFNNMYVPSGLVGINSAGKEQEIAGEFVKLLFQDEVQGIDLGDGYPVKPEVVTRWMEDDKMEGSLFAVSGPDSATHFSMESPLLDVRLRYAELYNKINTWMQEQQ